VTWAACIGCARSFGVWSSSSLLLLAIACGGEGDPAPAIEVEPAPEVAPEVAAVDAIDDCTALVKSAAHDVDDAALLPVLCPDAPLDAVTARGVLLAVGSSAEARAVDPLLHGFPELQSMARLVGHVASPTMPTTLADPEKSPVTPLDGSVLAQVQLARALLHDESTHVDTRTLARAYLAKAYMAALKQLGIGPTRPPSPFGRLLAAHAIHYGRSFCASFWQRQLPGLFDLCAQTEVDMLAATLALEASHYAGDSAIVAIELGEGRRYVSRDDARVRIEKRLQGSPESTVLDPDRLAPTVSDLERLLAQGFVEQAIARGLAIAGGPGLGPIEQLLRDGLQRSEGDEHRAQLEARFASVRKQAGRPVEDGAGELEHAREAPWVTATAEADRMLEAIAAAPASGFARRRALGRVVLAARRRPDALLAAIDLATSSTDAKIVSAVPLLRALAHEHDDGTLRWLRRARPIDPDARVRHDLALGTRDAAALPR
jgi:hypothetical protein